MMLPNKITFKLWLNYRIQDIFEAIAEFALESDCVFIYGFAAWLEAMLHSDPFMYLWALDEFWEIVISDNATR